MVGVDGPIEGYRRHFSKRFKRPEQKKLLPKTVSQMKYLRRESGGIW